MASPEHPSLPRSRWARDADDRLYRLLLEAPAYIAVHEGPDHTYVFSNELHDRVVGHRPLVGVPLRQAMPELEGQGIFERFDRVFETGESSTLTEMPATFDRFGDGQLVPGYFKQVLQAWRSPTGAIAGVMSFAFDVTDQIRSKELAAANRELRRINRQLDEFTYIVSHDLRQPLRGIGTYAHVLREDQGDRMNAEGLERLKTLTTLADRLQLLLDSVLQYSRYGQIALANEPVDLAAVVAVALEVLGPDAEGADIRVGDLPMVAGDAVQISQIFQNLIGNALKYNDKPNRIVEIGRTEEPVPPPFRASKPGPHDLATAGSTGGIADDDPYPVTPGAPGEPARDVDTANPGEMLTLFVRDNGIGIRRPNLEAIFQIFRRLRDKEGMAEGSGAGLTIVRKIVERHGGRIWAESEYGKGSTFYFTLPLAPERGGADR